MANDIDDTQGNNVEIVDESTDTDVLEAQLTILEAENIKLKAEVAGLEASKEELITLISESATVQAVLNTAAIALSEEIDEMQENILVFPDGLSDDDKEALKVKRQARIAELTVKHETYQKYIRGDI